MLHVSTHEFVSQLLVARRYNVRHILKKMSRRGLLKVVMEACGDEDFAPWRDIHRIGGTLELFDDVLCVRQTQRCHQEIAILLAALADPAPELRLGEPAQNLELQKQLSEVSVAIDCDDVPLTDVIAQVASDSGLPIGIDEIILIEYGLQADSIPVRLKVPKRPLDLVLRLLLLRNDLDDLVVIAEHGELVVTTSEYADGVSHHILYDLSDIAADAHRTLRLVELIQSQAGDDSNPWGGVDGWGGRILAPMRGIILVRQTRAVHREIRSLLADIRAGLASRPVERPVDPESYETRFYRLPAAMAEDCLVTIPRQVARGSWNDPIGELVDPAKGTLEMVEVGALWREFSSLKGLGGERQGLRGLGANLWIDDHEEAFVEAGGGLGLSLRLNRRQVAGEGTKQRMARLPTRSRSLTPYSLCVTEWLSTRSWKCFSISCCSAIRKEACNTDRCRPAFWRKRESETASSSMFVRDNGPELRGFHFAAGDQPGDVARLEPRVDVDHGNVRAAIEHAEQSGDAGEGCAVADAGRHGDDRTGNPAADHGGERSLHAGGDDHRIRVSQTRQLLQDPPRTGDAHIGDEFTLDVHPPERLHRFLGHGSITRAGSDDDDAAGRLRSVIRLRRAERAADLVPEQVGMRLCRCLRLCR